MLVQFARRELAELYLSQPDRVVEAEPLLRETIQLLQDRAAPMDLWVRIR